MKTFMKNIMSFCDGIVRRTIVKIVRRSFGLKTTKKTKQNNGDLEECLNKVEENDQKALSQYHPYKNDTKDNEEVNSTTLEMRPRGPSCGCKRSEYSSSIMHIVRPGWPS